MPKCQWIIEKGSRKNEECGIYTKKENNGKYYCTSHLKMAEKNETEEKPIKLKKTKTAKKINKKILENESSSDENDFNEDEIIEEMKDKTFIAHHDENLEEKLEKDIKKSIEEPKKKSKYVNRDEFEKLKKRVLDIYFLFSSMIGNNNKDDDKEPELETFK